MFTALVTPDKPNPADAGALLDRPGLPPAVDRVAGAAFCTDLDPVVIGFVRARIADHFAVPEDAIDALIAARLVGLATRLRTELEHIAAL